jgi:integrase
MDTQGAASSAPTTPLLRGLFYLRRTRLVPEDKSMTELKNDRFLRALLNKAHREWDWLESAPPIKMLPDTAKRTRWLTREEAQSLLNELPEHLSAMAAFTLATGLRESNVTGLQWAQIDMQRAIAWIHPEQAKSGKAISVPLNSDALRIIRGQIGKHLTHVFSYKGKPVTRANNHAWRKALARANINDFRWHDLRHTWASWHMQAGTPIHILKELGGWADLSMVMRYAHLSAEHIAGYANNVGSNLCDKSTTPTQNTKTKAA